MAKTADLSFETKQARRRALRARMGTQRFTVDFFRLVSGGNMKVVYGLFAIAAWRENIAAGKIIRQIPPFRLWKKASSVWTQREGVRHGGPKRK